MVQRVAVLCLSRSALFSPFQFLIIAILTGSIPHSKIVTRVESEPEMLDLQGQGSAVVMWSACY